MVYPCIVYSLEGVDTKHADNKNYRVTNKYDITYISRKQDISAVDQIMEYFEMISMNRPFTINGLYHYNFTLYF